MVSDCVSGALLSAVAADWQIEADVSPDPSNRAARYDALPLSVSLQIPQGCVKGFVCLHSGTLYCDPKAKSSCVLNDIPEQDAVKLSGK